MDPLLIAGILLIVGLLVLVAEAVLPSHGILGVMAGVALFGAIYYCFVAGPWLGITALAIFVVASPFVFMWMMEMWPRTPVGRRLVLTATVPQAPEPQQIKVGAEGRAVSELRPIGEADFGQMRVEVISEYGIIVAGALVKVVALDADGRPVVRLLEKL